MYRYEPFSKNKTFTEELVTADRINAFVEFKPGGFTCRAATQVGCEPGDCELWATASYQPPRCRYEKCVSSVKFVNALECVDEGTAQSRAKSAKEVIWSTRELDATRGASTPNTHVVVQVAGFVALTRVPSGLRHNHGQPWRQCVYCVSDPRNDRYSSSRIRSPMEVMCRNMPTGADGSGMLFSTTDVMVRGLAAQSCW